MRRLVNYLRQAFCPHVFIYAEAVCIEQTEGYETRRALKVSATCKACGYHRSYWKF